MVAWKNLRKLSSLAVGTGAGLTVYFYKRLRHSDSIVQNSWVFSEIPLDKVGKWDTNWDYRDPKSCVTPIKDDTPQEKNRYNNELDKMSVKATRHIVLVRHGQFLDVGEHDKDHHLTELGRLQAKYTGKRLQELAIKWDEIIVSTMTRAQETSEIIFKEIEYEPQKVKYCDFLREGVPISPDTPLLKWRVFKMRCLQDHARIEAAFTRYIHRASPEQNHDSYTLIVAHANVIRYIVCRALQLSPETWLRLNINHGSITWLTINPSGNVSLQHLGESGYMPKNCLTSHLPRDVKK
ncbi:serine/threonine-protein phosphatase Pgam5, mitochondrial-like [Eurosta solidaginis]|uniref:serine/threonine-protein phosphatase Pgam5, mitochondrial-like n=1 Tax=Eurosta solidaginis TaxID=178769 RepID=UPI003530BFFD